MSHTPLHACNSPEALCRRLMLSPAVLIVEVNEALRHLCLGCINIIISKQATSLQMFLQLFLRHQSGVGMLSMQKKRQSKCTGESAGVQQI